MTRVILELERHCTSFLAEFIPPVMHNGFGRDLCYDMRRVRQNWVGSLLLIGVVVSNDTFLQMVRSVSKK